MDKEKVQLCIKRASRWKVDSSPELSEESIDKVEQQLKLILPIEFRVLCTFYGYDFFRFFDFLNFEREDGVIKHTQIWRQNINLPENYIVLSEDSESAVLMRIDKKQAEVIWCSLEDVFNLCDGLPMQYNPTIFPTFTAFYEFLLDEEEKLRAGKEAE